MWPFNRHRHRWNITGVRCGEFTFRGGDATQILRVCECGDRKVDTMSGFWTLDQIEGKRVDTPK